MDSNAQVAAQKGAAVEDAGEATGLTRVSLAARLLGAIQLQAIREKVRRDREWATAFKGFRPGSVSQEVAVGRARHFALDMGLLRSLCDLALDELHIDEHHDFVTRLRHVAETTGKHPEIAAALGNLIDKPLSALPMGNLAEVAPVARGVHVGPGHPSDPKGDGGGSTEAAAPPGPPAFLSQPVMLDWEPPDDHVSQVQEAVTLFNRSLVAFVHRQLEGAHGPAWLKRCVPQKMREEWLTKSETKGAVAPATLLGYAELGDLITIITRRDNWPYFKAYFRDPDAVRSALTRIIPARISAMHPEQRYLEIVDQVSALQAMMDLAAAFHPETAHRVGELFKRIVPGGSPKDADEASGEPLEFVESSARDKIVTNLGDFLTPQLIGREPELQQLGEFWSDTYGRVFSIAGQGGVGKTALLESFIHSLASAPLPSGKPDPEAIIYLTAKENYLPGMKKPPEGRKFKTLRQIYESTLLTIEGQVPPDADLKTLRDAVFGWAKELRIFFALDNLETIRDDEYAELADFLDNVPAPSKIILTTREDRRVGKSIVLPGLSKPETVKFLQSHLATFGVSISDSDCELVYERTKGVPLTLVWCVNDIGLGASVNETLEALTGKRFLEFLEFSFESSIQRLDESAMKVLLYLAISRAPRARRDLEKFVEQPDDLNTTLKRLLSLSLIERSVSESGPVKFEVGNPQLRDYVRARGADRLSKEEYAFVLRSANVLPAQAESPSVLIEVNKAIDQARELGNTAGWEHALRALDQARAVWGDDPRLLAELGYAHYRTGRRKQAIELMERALALGFESAVLYARLALVLYYERRYDDGIRRAETALTLRSEYPFAEQVLSQCLEGKVRRDRFVMDDAQHRQLLMAAVEHAERALYQVPRTSNEIAANQRTRELMERLKDQLERFEHADKTFVRTAQLAW